MRTELIWARSLLNLTESEWGLGKIWAEVVALTAKNYTRINIKFKNNKV